MKNIGKYCKAYPIKRLREFPGWTEIAGNARKQGRQADGKEALAPRQLSDGDYLYLQVNFVVTDGIFLDENVIFDLVTPEWIEYCKNHLRFEEPDFDSRKSAAADELEHQVQSSSQSASTPTVDS